MGSRALKVYTNVSATNISYKQNRVLCSKRNYFVLSKTSVPAAKPEKGCSVKKGNIHSASEHNQIHAAIQASRQKLYSGILMKNSFQRLFREDESSLFDPKMLQQKLAASTKKFLQNLNQEKGQVAMRNQVRNAARFFRAVSKPPEGKLLEGEKCTKTYSQIPGPTKWPIFGSALAYSALGKYSPKEFNKALECRHAQYGNIFVERILNEDFVYISDPKDIRVLVQNEGPTPCRPHLDAIVESRKQESLPVGITAMQGDEWSRNRNAVNTGISPPNIVRQYRKSQKKVAQDFVKFMAESRDKDSGEVADFEQWLNRWALESVAVVLLDTRLNLFTTKQAHNSASEKLRVCMDVFFDYGARLTFGMPTWKIWNTKAWKIFRKSQRDEFKYAGYFVDKKLKELEEKSAYESKDSQPKAASCLLEHVIKDRKLSRDEALTVCLELLAGGIDTTASTTVFTMFQLAKHPEHQDRLREILLEEENETPPEANKNGSGCPFANSKKQSKFSSYLKACVWESMRLNPLTYANMRKTNKELVLSGYKIPVGATVRYTSHLVNLKNEEYFPESEKFIPDRWANRKSEHRCKEQFTFMPFGHGARQCPGRRVAEQEVDLLFREILKNFRIEYHHEDIGTKVRLFNCADKPAKFSFVPI